MLLSPSINRRPVIPKRQPRAIGPPRPSNSATRSLPWRHVRSRVAPTNARKSSGGAFFGRTARVSRTDTPVTDCPTRQSRSRRYSSTSMSSGTRYSLRTSARASTTGNTSESSGALDAIDPNLGKEVREKRSQLVVLDEETIVAVHRFDRVMGTATARCCQGGGEFDLLVFWVQEVRRY